MATVANCLVLAVLLFSDRFSFVSGQFPAVCNTEYHLTNKICCPDDCNTASGRGVCTDITTQASEQWTSADQNSVLSDIVWTMENIIPLSEFGNKLDSRLRWPTAVFNDVCICSDPFFGPDCSECKFGYEGPDCANKSQPLLRQPYVDLELADQEAIVSILHSAKVTDHKPWAVIVDEPESGSNDTVKLQNVTTYHLFVNLHFMSARDGDSNCQTKFNSKFLNMTGRDLQCYVDFAHQGPNFATWHRYFLLLLERELQKVSLNPEFALPYWDWERDDGRSILNNDLLGNFDLDGKGDAKVCDGHLKIGRNWWHTVCDQNFQLRNNLADGEEVECRMTRKACDVDEDLEKLNELCRFGNPNQKRKLPYPFELTEALKDSTFEEPNRSWNESQGFRNKLEGFETLSCGDDPDINSSDKALHNKVHIYINGHMDSVPTASNDPIFFFHHANVDRIFEMWLKEYGDNVSAYEPKTNGHPGHNVDDWLVPLFPLMTNADMFKRSTELGYEYNNLEFTDPNTCERLSAPPIRLTTRGTSTPATKGPYTDSARALSFWISLIIVPLVMLLVL